MRRREFIAGLGIAAAVQPRAARARQSNVPVICTLQSGPYTEVALAGFRSGLAELGFVEGRDFHFEVRSPNFNADRVPILIRELLDQGVSLFALSSTSHVAAAKQIVHSIPVVFTIASDPVENGFVESLNKPGGNITGIFTLGAATSAKRVHLLRELLPSVEKFVFLTNPKSPKVSVVETRAVREAAELAGVSLLVIDAGHPDEFEPAIETAVREGAGGVIFSTEGIFVGSWSKLVMLAGRYRLPAIYSYDEPLRDGGLITYGADLADSRRLVGVYAGRILKGEKPQNMPVQLSTKTRLGVNLKTAKDLGITVPPMLLSRADEVIE